MNIHLIANNLYQEEGLFFSKSKTEISYPEEGNADCAQIEDNSFWFKHRNKCIETVVKKYGEGKPFFDIGGGNGFVAKGIQLLGIETVLVEPGISGCLNAQKRNIKTIVCSTLEDAGFLPNNLPSAGMFDVVEHIEDDITFLKNIYAFLETNGLVYITVPAYQMLWSYEDDYAGHFRRYTIESISDKLRAVGFEMVYSTYIFSILPLPIFLTRSLPSKFSKSKPAYNIEKAKDAHLEKKGSMQSVLNNIWQWELSQIEKGKKIPFGGSCLIVAKKR